MSTDSFRYVDPWTRRLLYALVVVLTAMVMFPFLWLLLLSFKSTEDIFAGASRLLSWPTLANYASLWESDFRRSFINSAIVSTASTLLAMAIGVPGAYALSRTAMRAEKSLSLLILTSRMAPPIAFTIPYFLAYRYMGLLDTRTGLVLIYLTFNLSLVVWLMRSFFDSCPRSLEEAAWIDGASMWQTFMRIVLPISGPGLAATAILCFLYSWNDFFFSLILTRKVAMTAPVAVVNFMNYEGWEWGRIAAGGTMVMLPVLVFSIAVRKFLIHGMTAGAVKG
ncbi:MAG: carbohydrate ABC transporter permease [Burkholderiales bacterium]